jgi:hypothetical protein
MHGKWQNLLMTDLSASIASVAHPLNKVVYPRRNLSDRMIAIVVRSLNVVAVGQAEQVESRTNYHYFYYLTL